MLLDHHRCLFSSFVFQQCQGVFEGFSNLSEAGARGLLNLGEKKHFDHQDCENLMQSKRTGPPFLSN